jgi:hypothetical protein
MTGEFTAHETPSNVRLAEANYLFEQHVAHCGPPDDSYFLMVTYFDAFIFTFGTLRDVVTTPEEKAKIKHSPILAFFQALRNINTHHSIVAAPLATSKFTRPFSRHLPLSNTGQTTSAVRLAFRFDVLRKILADVEIENEKSKPLHDRARPFIDVLEARAQPVFLDDVVREALAEARSIIPPDADPATK